MKLPKHWQSLGSGYQKKMHTQVATDADIPTDIIHQQVFRNAKYEIKNDIFVKTQLVSLYTNILSSNSEFL